MVLTINSDCFPKQHYPVGLCSGDVMFPVRYGLDSYILFPRNSVLKELLCDKANGATVNATLTLARSVGNIHSQNPKTSRWFWV
jgi:hypothetical protein